MSAAQHVKINFGDGLKYSPIVYRADSELEIFTVAQSPDAPFERASLID
jgi:hypothetical protein